jgi:hypothetical protein
MQERCVLNCIVVRTQMLDAQHQPVKKLHVVIDLVNPIRYLHAIELVKNLSLWPVRVSVRSELQVPSQVRYVRTAGENEWVFETSLSPNRGLSEQTALMEFKQEGAGREDVSTIFLTDSGFTDNLVLPIDFE